jgi:hypothetical protein
MGFQSLDTRGRREKVDRPPSIETNSRGRKPLLRGALRPQEIDRAPKNLRKPAILGAVRFRPDFTPLAVGLYIMSAYWFTASTSFANPAVTIARTLSNTFAGIAPSSAPAFIAAQFAGAAAAVAVFGWMLRETRPE